jgi:hypothetical protein
MVVFFVSISLLIILFYASIFFTEQTREENKENKRKMEFYNRINIKGTPFIEDYKGTSNN